jgi:uncharacterized protein (DUF302 family)
MSDLAFAKNFEGSVDQALERLDEELKSRGFGILASIRIHDVLKEKIGVSVDPAVILDVCSPRDAHRALSVSRDASLLLPCKIVVSREHGRTRIALQRPTVALSQLLPLPELQPLGEEVEGKLRSAIEATTANQR